MFDLFGTKAKNDLIQKNERLEKAIAQLKTDLRAVDQLVYEMGQCQTWDGSRTKFLKLQALCGPRQKAESDRVAQLILDQLNKV